MTSYYFPQGIIIPFDQSCPSGWTEVTNMRNRFPKGSTSFGDMGGSSTHTHTVNTQNSDALSGGTNGERLCIGGGTKDYSEGYHRHSWDRDIFTSEAASNIPPYVKVMFCEKS